MLLLAQILMWCMVVPEMCAIVMFHVDLWLNFYRTPKDDASLSQIYQASQHTLAFGMIFLFASITLY